MAMVMLSQRHKRYSDALNRYLQMLLYMTSAWAVVLHMTLTACNGSIVMCSESSKTNGNEGDLDDDHSFLNHSAQHHGMKGDEM